MWMKWVSGWLLLAGILFNTAACGSYQRHLNIERRNEIESKMMRGEYLHDGAVELASLGDIDSVPALLVVLRENPAKPNGVMVCTTAHALITLKTLTGADAGITHEAWSTWWEDYKKKNPVSRRLES